jgi:hypothetical protein
MDRTLDVAQSSMTNLHLPFSFLFQDLWRDSVTFVPGARDASHAPSFSSDKFGKIFKNKRTINIFYNFTMIHSVRVAILTILHKYKTYQHVSTLYL